MKKTNSNIRLFVDFDGTVTEKDVGDGIFTKFMRGDPALHDKLIADWKAGLISSHQCLTQECENSEVTEDELQDELDSYDLTPGFKETAKFCWDNGIPITILSDGMDYYIEYILSRHGLKNIQFRSNHMYFNDGSMIVEFPFFDKGCGRCGNCKRWHMDVIREDSEKIVYAGDGYSDRFAIKSADVVFARRDLENYCRNTNHEYIPFGDFYQILHYLENGNEKS